jgi:Double-stranded RNA binding motif
MAADSESAAKNTLQEWCQGRGEALPKYKTRKRGEDHLAEFVSVCTTADDRRYEGGWRSTKRDAEKSAAHVAYQDIQKRRKAPPKRTPAEESAEQPEWEKRVAAVVSRHLSGVRPSASKAAKASKVSASPAAGPTRDEAAAKVLATTEGLTFIVNCDEPHHTPDIRFGVRTLLRYGNPENVVIFDYGNDHRVPSDTGGVAQTSDAQTSAAQTIATQTLADMAIEMALDEPDDGDTTVVIGGELTRMLVGKIAEIYDMSRYIYARSFSHALEQYVTQGNPDSSFE